MPVGRVNYVLRAINIKAGNHTVTLSFKPQSVKNTETAAYVAYLLLVLAIIAGVLFEMKRNKKECNSVHQ